MATNYNPTDWTRIPVRRWIVQLRDESGPVAPTSCVVYATGPEAAANQAMAVMEDWKERWVIREVSVAPAEET